MSGIEFWVVSLTSAVIAIFAARVWDKTFLYRKERARYDLIEELRDGYWGNSIEIVCDNDDPDNDEESCVVRAFGGWTEWEIRNFFAKTVDAALVKAVIAKRKAEGKKELK